MYTILISRDIAEVFKLSIVIYLHLTYTLFNIKFATCDSKMYRKLPIVDRSSPNCFVACSELVFVILWLMELSSTVLDNTIKFRDRLRQSGSLLLDITFRPKVSGRVIFRALGRPLLSLNYIVITSILSGVWNMADDIFILKITWKHSVKHLQDTKRV